MPHGSTSPGPKNVVLVHGGFVDGSGWEGVYKALKQEGYTVAVVQNPTISLADDVESPGSHAVYVSRPQAVASIIETAAQGVPGAVR